MKYKALRNYIKTYIKYFDKLTTEDVDQLSDKEIVILFRKITILNGKREDSANKKGLH